MSHNPSESKLFRCLPCPCAIADRKGNIDLINPSWTEALGWQPSEIKSRSIQEFVHTDDLSRLQSIIAEECESQDEVECLLRLRTSEGKYRTFRWTIFGDQETLYFTGHKVDAIDPMNPQDRLESLANTVPGAIFQWYERTNGERGFYYVSPRITDFYDLTPEELVDDWMKIRIHPEDLAPLLASIDLASKTSSDWKFEGRFLLDNDEIRWWRGISTPFRISDSETIFNGFLMDVTAEKATARELQELSDRLQLAVKGTNDGIWDWDLQNDTMWFSPRWKDILGYEDEELSNSHETWQNMILPEDHDDAWRLAEAFNSGEIDEYVATHRYLHKDGSIRYLLSRATHQNDKNGRVTRMVGAVTDITELIQAREQAEESSRAKSSFLANMSHEIRTPMNGMLGMAQVLRTTKLSSEQIEFVDAITSSGQSLLVVLNDILDVSKIEAGKLILDPSPCSIQSLFLELGQLFRPIALAKGIEFNVYLPIESVPTLLIDSSRVKQVITNLVGNSLKFTNQGNVSISASYQNGNLRVEVTDTGIGISEDRQEAVFDSFTQADPSTSRQYGGTGLGLTICKNLIRLMYGEMGLSSLLDKGSSFWFQIPASICDAPKVEPLGPTLPAAANRLTGKILLAEDNEVNVLVAQILLEQMGFEVDVASDEVEAVNLVMENDYRLVLMDLHMPNMDGADATRAIRQLQAGKRRTPIIAMTAAAMHEDRDKCFEAGMDAYISKPFKAEEVQALLLLQLANSSPT